MAGIAETITNIVGGSVTDGIAKIISLFKVDPNIALQKSTEIEEIKLQMAGKLQDAVSNEITQAAEVIKAEAQSQSWLPRNVRPLLLLLWGVLITVNYLVVILAHFFPIFATMQPLVLPDWLYKLTAIGFTGYVTARTWEKVKDSDN